MSLITGQQGGGSGQGGDASGGAGGAGNQPDWRTSLPEDLRSEKIFESIKGKDWTEAGPVLAKNYVHAQRLIGADKVVIPTDKSTPEEIASFRTKIGVPSKPEEYTFKLPEGLTETQLDKARIDSWRKELHEAGVPRAAAERIMSRYIADEHGLHQTRLQNQTKEREQWELAIKQEFGVKFDEQVNNARYALRTFGSEKLNELLDSTGFGSHPEIVRLFAKIGEKLSDDNARGSGGGGRGSSTATPDLAQAALNEFNRNAENMKALFDKDHPMHEQKVKERRELFEAAFPKSQP